MTHLDILAKTTSTGAANGSGVDISGITADWTLVLEVQAQNDGDGSRFVFQDSADNFSSDILSGPSASVSGKVTNSAVKRYTWQKRDFPNLRFGVTSAKLRLSLAELTGSSKSVTYAAWVEY